MFLFLIIELTNICKTLRIIADGSEPFILLGCLIIIYFAVDANIRERKKVNKVIKKILDQSESIEINYGHISKSYYWIFPDKSYKRILILKRPNKVIIMDNMYDYFEIKGLKVSQEQSIIKKFFRRNQLIDEYTLNFILRAGFQENYVLSIKMSTNDKIYSNPSFIRSNRKKFIPTEKVVNELDYIINEVARNNRKNKYTNKYLNLN